MIEKITKTDRRAEIVSYVIVAVFTIIPALMMTYPSSTVDELGHLSNAAYLAGYDWSDGIHSAGDYYFKYGTAVFYYLPMLLVTHPLLRYRICLIIGAVVLTFSAPIAYAITRRYLQVEDRTKALLIALIASCPAAVLYQSNFARADWTLVITAWVTLYGVLRASDAADKRAKIGFTILASFSAVYAYMSHTRGIVTVIALFLVVLLGYLFYRLKPLHIPAYLLSTAGFLVLDRVLSRYFRYAIWTYGRGHSALEVMDFGFYKRIFTPEGFKILIKGTVGWLFSVASSTYGVITVGCFAALAICFLSLSRKKERKYTPAEILTAFFGILNFIGNLALGILFFYNKIYHNLTGEVNIRADRVLYERYMVCALGILCALALALIIREGKLSTKVDIISVAVQALCVVISALAILPIYDTQATNKKMMVSVTSFYYFFDKESTALTVAGIVGVAALVVWLLLIRKGYVRTAMILIFMAFVLTFSWTWYKNRYKYSEGVAKEMAPAIEKVMEIYGTSGEYPDIFVDSSAHKVQTYQPIFRDYHVINTKIDRYKDNGNMLIIARGSYRNPEGFDELYTFDDINYGGKAKRDLVYVKGTELKEKLEELGQSLSPYEAG